MILRKISALSNTLKKDHHIKEIIKGSFTYFLLRVFGTITGFAFTLMVTRQLGATAWGIYTLVITILQISSVVATAGLDNAILKFTAEYSAQKRGDTVRKIYYLTISVVFLLSTILSFFLYTLSPFLAEDIFGKPYLISYIRLASLFLLPFSLLSVNIEGLRAFKQIKSYVFFQGIFPSSFALLLVFLSFSLSSELSNIRVVLTIYLFSTTTSSIGGLLLMINQISRLPQKGESLPFSYVFSVSFPMFLSRFLFISMSWIGIFMIGIWCNNKDIGIYNVAFRLASLTSFTLVAINTITAPKLAEFWGNKDLKNLKKIAKQSAKLSFWASFPILTLYLLFPGWIMEIFGKEFREGKVTLVILALAYLIDASGGSKGFLLQMTKFQKENVLVLLTMLITNFTSNIFFIPKFGIVGAALSFLLSIITGNIIIAYIIYTRFKFSIYYLPLPLENTIKWRMLSKLWKNTSQTHS